MNLTYSISDRFLSIKESHQLQTVDEMTAFLKRIRRENVGKSGRRQPARRHDGRRGRNARGDDHRRGEGEGAA